jgi:hypothetical protein
MQHKEQKERQQTLIDALWASALIAIAIAATC